MLLLFRQNGTQEEEAVEHTDERTAVVEHTDERTAVEEAVERSAEEEAKEGGQYMEQTDQELQTV